MTEFCQASDSSASIAFSLTSGETQSFSIENPPLILLESLQQTKWCWITNGSRVSYPPGTPRTWLHIWPVPGRYPTGIPHSLFSARSSGSLNTYHFFFDNNFAFEITNTFPFQLNRPILINTQQEYDFYSNPSKNLVTGGYNWVDSDFDQVADIFNSDYSQYFRLSGAYPFYSSYNVACGGCPPDTFSAEDNSPKGYACIPYEDIINWSKQERQRLNQIGRNLK